MTISTDLAISNSMSACQALSLNIGRTGKFWRLFLMNFVDKDGATKVCIPFHHWKAFRTFPLITKTLTYLHMFSALV